MKKLIITIMIVAVAMTSFAKVGDKTVKKKMNPQVQKQLKYFKLLANEEKNILDKYITCLNTVDTGKGIQVCNQKRREMAGKLRQISSPAHRQKAKKQANIKQPIIEKK